MRASLEVDRKTDGIQPCSTPLSAMSPAEVTEKLGLHRMRDRSWFVHPSCATSGEVSSPDWLTEAGPGQKCNVENLWADQNDFVDLAHLQGLFEGLSWLSANVKKQQP